MFRSDQINPLSPMPPSGVHPMWTFAGGTHVLPIAAFKFAKAVAMPDMSL